MAGPWRWKRRPRASARVAFLALCRSASARVAFLAPCRSAIALIALVVALVLAPGAFAAGESVQAWLTSTSGQTIVSPLAPQPPLRFGRARTGGTAVTVDPSTSYQSIAGFGGTLTSSAAELIFNSPDRNQIMSQLFGPGGADFSVVRVPMGSSDASLTNFTYAEACCSLIDFSILPDLAYTIPLLRQALQLDPGLQVIALPWSAPNWMKFGGTLSGTCQGSANYLINAYYPLYAAYFSAFVAAYEVAGVPISAVSLQNEPHTCNWTYPTMNMEPGDESNFALDLRAALDSGGFGGVKIIAGEVDWYENGAPTSYPQQVLSYGGGQAAAAVDGVAYHCYDSPVGSYSVQSTFHAAYARKAVYATECSSGSWAPNPVANLVWEVQNNLIGPLRNWAVASLYWSLALDPWGGPNVGGCSDCRGMVTVNPDGTFTENGEYYAWAQFSRAVVPGAVRIASPDDGDGGVQTVAFRNPDGSIALVALNSSAGAIPVDVDWAGQSFAYTLPARAVASFRWTPGAYTAYELVNGASGRCLDAAGWGVGNGTAVQQWTCGAQANQEWELRPHRGSYDLLNRNAAAENMVLEVSGGPSALADGAPVQLWSSTGATNQQWGRIPVGGGWYEIAVRSSGKCLTVPSGAGGDGVQLVQAACRDAPGQQFSFVRPH